MLYEAEAPRSFRADLCLFPFVVPLVQEFQSLLGQQLWYLRRFICHHVPDVDLYDAAGDEMRCLSLRVAYLRFRKWPTGSAYPLVSIATVQHTDTVVLVQHFAELACSGLDHMIPWLLSGARMLSTQQGPGY